MRRHFNLIIYIVTLSFLIPGNPTSVRGADSADSGSTEKTLSQLEDRFFEREYDTDSPADRLNRLDEFIYGADQSGSTTDRLNHILSTIPDETADSSKAVTNQNADLPASSSNNTTDRSDQTSSSTNNSSEEANEPSSGNPFDYSSYPRVTTLEQELLGRTYASDSLPQRLARMETKAFGSPSSSTDLGQRTDLLDDYAQRHDLYGEHNPSANPATAISSAANGQSQNSIYNRAPSTAPEHLAPKTYTHPEMAASLAVWKNVFR